jgi:hypothetical protein
MPPLAFIDAQIEQIKISGYQVPHRLRANYLERLVALLPRDFGDGRSASRRRRRAARGPGQWGSPNVRLPIQ